MSLSRHRRPAKISVTPLIDVVFILLVFFMLASRFEDWRSIDLSSTAHGPAAATDAQGAMLVEVRTDGLRFAGAPIALEDLMARLAERLRAAPEQRVLLSPGAGVDMQRVVTTLDALSAAGARNIALLGA